MIWAAEAEGSFAITDNLRFDGNVTKLNGNFTDSYLALDPSLAAAPDWFGSQSGDFLASASAPSTRDSRRASPRAA